MVDTSSTAKKALTIKPCVVNRKGEIVVDTVRGIFEAMINPSGFSHNLSVAFSEKQVPGQPGAETKFNSTNTEELVVKELVIDGTGVVRTTNNAPPPSPGFVKKQIELLKKVIYVYNGDKHEPSIVQLSWGDSLLFYARAKSLKVDYTLFTPDGVVLRAKVTLEFVQYQSNQEIALKSDKRSPDLTHLVEVKAGDTLPLLCYQIYQDCSYYTQVARINNLTNFRDLELGTKLQFPPLS